MAEKVSIDKFCDTFFKINAPLKYSENEYSVEDVDIINEINNITENKNIYYPYKPFLLLSILQSFNDESIFNKIIDLSEIDIVKRFYDFLTNDLYLFTILKYHKHKTSWWGSLGISYREISKKSELYKSILSTILGAPLDALLNTKFVRKINSNSIIINVDIENWENDLKILISKCCKNVRKCIPWYDHLSDYEILSLNKDGEDVAELLDNKSEKFIKLKTRTRQHIFRKKVLDRDLKCCICCADSSLLLDACHIKPYSACINDYEAYNETNGIVLCKNHHTLFDNGFFTFSKDWKVKISNKLNDSDISLFFKQYEKCYTELSNRNPSYNNIFIDYHNKSVFKK